MSGKPGTRPPRLRYESPCTARIRPPGEIVPWQNRELPCRDDPELFHTTNEDDQRRAKRICISECPVRDDCLNHALKYGEWGGIWGGLTANERKRHLQAKGTK